jgi:hypothetical protein
LRNWKADVLELIQEAARTSGLSKNRKIAEATAEVMNAMADDGLVGPTNVHPYALVMNELIASGALRIGQEGSDRAVGPTR